MRLLFFLEAALQRSLELCVVTQWELLIIAIRPTSIEKGTRICQFRVQLSQKATTWQKIKWLFTSGVKLVEVDDLGNDNRGGFGSAGVK